MTQPYDERPVAPAAPQDGPHEEAHAEAPSEATPPQEATAPEPPTREAPADDTGAPTAPSAVGPDAPQPDAAEPDDSESGATGTDAVEPDAGATDAPDTQDRAVTAQIDAAGTRAAPAVAASSDGAASPDDEGFGDPRVDDAVARLHDLAGRPVGEHAEVFDDIHQRLRDALEEAAVEPAEEPRG